MGLRPSVYVDAGSLWSITPPPLTDVVASCTPKTGTTGLTSFISPQPNCSIDYSGNAHDGAQFDSTPGFKELFLGNSPKPRLSIGIGVNWISPFGPLRLDLAKALLKQKGDDTKLFQFNVGTSF
jgi:outer membrane protein insertion porin family